MKGSNMNIQKFTMKKSLIIPVLFMGLTSFVVLGTYKTGGGHPSSTGAPGEATCSDATTGCHSDATINKDSVNLVNTFSYSAADSSYTPGQTYTISIAAVKSGIQKFGFEVVALKKSDNGNIGTWIVTEATRTHAITGAGALASRSYLTHSLDGTPAVSSGLGKWSFKWKAPSTSQGKITFYYATSCTNNNNANTGEQLFLSSFTIHPISTASTSPIAKGSKLNVTYDPSTRKLLINYHLNSAAIVGLSVFDLQGKQIQGFQTTNRPVGFNKQELELPVPLSKGIYLVNFEVGDQKVTEKILVQ